MLRTNLATRPFYNLRAVRLGLFAGVVLGAALTAFNVGEIYLLNRQNAELLRRTDAAEARARELRGRASATRKTLDEGDVAIVQAAAREANLLIERRSFSWTELFNRFEETLPADVRITAVQPQIDNEGRMLVAVTVVSRGVEDLNAFLDALNATKDFREVISRQDTTQEDGTLRSVLQGYYRPQDAVPAAGQPAPASDPKNDATNGSAKPSTPAAPRSEP